MLFKSTKGMFQVQKNYRNAFDLEMFLSKYIEECFDKYPYIVGDISSGILRLKGFDTNPKSDANINNVQSYLETSCSFGCPYYILKRVKSDGEYEHLANQEKNKKEEVEKSLITPLVKENFDKETLVLISNPKGKSKIIIDSTKINKMPEGHLPKDIEETKNQDIKETKNVVETKAQVETTSYVSASPDFDPSKIKKNNRNNNTNNKNSNQKTNNSNKQNNSSNNRKNNQNNNSNNQQNKNNKHKKFNKN